MPADVYTKSPFKDAITKSIGDKGGSSTKPTSDALSSGKK
jgi:hypothetical protein